MKTFIAIAILGSTIISAQETPLPIAEAKSEINVEPPNGMPTAESHDLGYKFLELLDKKANFEESNDWEKNKLTRYISSGGAGHSVTIYGVLDVTRQIEILQMAQDILNAGDFGRVYMEFRDAERFTDTGGGSQSRSGEKLLRSRIMKKQNKAEMATPSKPSD